MKDVVTDSEAFKMGWLKKLAKGCITLRVAARKNGIMSVGSVVKWVKKYGREDILPKRVKVLTMKEVDEMNTARKRIREMEAALANLQTIYTKVLVILNEMWYNIYVSCWSAKRINNKRHKQL